MRMLLAIVAMFFVWPAMAQTLSGGSSAGCDIGVSMQQAATSAADRERQLIEQIAARQKQLAMQTGTCVDKYMNLSLSSLVGFGSLDLGGILGGLISGAANAACQAIDNQISQVTQPFNQSMVLPGGMGRVDTRVFGLQGASASVTGSVPGVLSPTTIGSVGSSTSTGTNTSSGGASVIDQARNAVSNLFK